MKTSAAAPDEPNPNGEYSLLRTSGVTEKQITDGTLATHTQAAMIVQRLHEQKRGWFTRLVMDKKLENELRLQKIQTVRDYAEYNRAMMRLATDTKLDMSHSVCLAMSRELKVGNQEKFTTLVLEKAESLRRTVLAKQEEFLADMDSAYTTVERYAHRPQLMERAIGSLAAQEERYFGWIDGLLDDFMSISKQRLDEYRKADATAARPALGTGPGLWSA